MLQSETLFYAGLIGMAATAVLSVLIGIIRSIKKKRLKKVLEDDYGVIK